MLQTISEDKFYDKYQPIDNKFDDNASFDGKLYETFGEELDYCFELSKKENRVWTIIECDDEDYIPDDEDEDYEIKACMCILSGFHIVNRIGFMITEVPYDHDIEVKLDL